MPSAPSPGPVGAAPARRQLARALLFTAGGAAAVLLFHREMLLGGFALVPGDGGDTQLLVRILEHWIDVGRGAAPWRSPAFFHPVPGVLGYSDPLFLFALPFGLARALGLDAYSAYQALLLLLTAIGYAGMALLLRSGLGLSVPASALGAFLFATLNAMSRVANHGQLYSVFLLPLLAWLGLRYLERARAPRGGGWGSGIAAAALLALLFFTSFYVAWFFTLFALLLAALALVGERVAGREAADAGHTRRPPLAQAAVLLLVFAAGLTPFLLAHLPPLRELPGRGYNRGLLPTAPDLVNLGSDNLVWGGWLPPLSRIVGPQSAEHELHLGVPPLLLLLFAATVLGAARALAAGRLRSDAERERARAVALTAMAVAVSLLLMLRVAGHSPWWLVRKLVPGAAALAAPSRNLLVLAIPVIAVAMLGLDALWRRARAATSRTARAVAASLLVALAAALVLEQVNTGALLLLRKADKLALHARFSPRPPDCAVAYVVPTPRPTRPAFEAQNDAMLIAARAGIPTINGYSGNVPRGWALADPAAPDYPDAVNAWLSRHGLARGACGLDLDAGAWVIGPIGAAPRDAGSRPSGDRAR